MEMRVIDPIAVECVCKQLSQEDLRHLLFVGDKRWENMLVDREMCIERGHLEID